MTKTLVAPPSPVRYAASALPWASSLPMTRCQVVQPCWVIVTLVADGEIDGRPASKKVLPVASDSPEKPGPISPKMESSLTIWVARPGAVSGLPWESNFFRLTWQSGFLSLYCWSASSIPPTMFWPSAPASPVRAPMNARFLPQRALLALPSDEPPSLPLPPPLSLLPQALSIRPVAATAARTRADLVKRIMEVLHRTLGLRAGGHGASLDGGQPSVTRHPRRGFGASRLRRLLNRDQPESTAQGVRYPVIMLQRSLRIGHEPVSRRCRGRAR